LIVDDSQEDLVFAQRVMLGCKILNPVIPFSSGKAFLDYFANQLVTAHPAIILLDMIMKPVSGLDVLRRVRDLPAAKNSVFIMLSGMADTKTIAEGYCLGACTFLFKPLVAAELNDLFRSATGLELVRTASGNILSVVRDPASRRSQNLIPPRLLG